MHRVLYWAKYPLFAHSGQMKIITGEQWSKFRSFISLLLCSLCGDGEEEKQRMGHVLYYSGFCWLDLKTDYDDNDKTPFSSHSSWSDPLSAQEQTPWCCHLCASAAPQEVEYERLSMKQITRAGRTVCLPFIQISTTCHLLGLPLLILLLFCIDLPITLHNPLQESCPLCRQACHYYTLLLFSASLILLPHKSVKLLELLSRSPRLNLGFLFFSSFRLSSNFTTTWMCSTSLKTFQKSMPSPFP